MNIGYFVTRFPYINYLNDTYLIKKYSFGGAETVAYYLARGMAQRGHEIKVFTTSLLGFKHQNELYSDNFKVYRYASPKICGIPFPINMFRDPLRYSLDIVHAHSSIPVAIYAAILYAVKKRVPLIITYHGDPTEYSGKIVRDVGIRFYNRHLADKILSIADIIVCPSEFYIYESKFLAKHKKKVITIPNGIDIKRFNVHFSQEKCRKILKLNSTKYIVLFLSALHHLKGPSILLKAISEVIKEERDVIFVFAGHGNISKYEAMSRKLGIHSYVRFMGYIKEELKPLIYKSADIFVFPSIGTFEVFPMVLLEASASGLPIIASDLNTCKCFIKDGYNGFFVKKGDSKSLANIIIYLLRNEKIRREIGRNAKEKVKAYSWEKIAEKYEEVYQRLIK